MRYQSACFSHCNIYIGGYVIMDSFEQRMTPKIMLVSAVEELDGSHCEISMV